MTLRIDHPCDTVRQESGKDPQGQYILSVLAKRTYTVLVDGRCVPAEEQLPLVEVPEADEELPDVLGQDTDLHAFKPLSDIVIRGHAYGYRHPTHFYALVRLGRYENRILVVGDRTCSLQGKETVRFSPPAPVEKVPLSYAHAYGGVDEAAEAKYGNPLALPLEGWVDPAGMDLGRLSLFRYPRNPCGRGFLTEFDREAVESMVLPNLEDPWDLLTPERLVAGGPERWLEMPIPRSTGWVNYDWFPRVAYFGVVPPHAPPETPPTEVQRGYALEDVLEATELSAPFVARGMCGASLGLQLPFLRDGQEIQLENLHPTQARWSVRLPESRPRIWTDGRKGRFNPTEPVIHTVLIEPDEDRVSVLWRGSAPALRPYLPDELEKMPLFVDWAE